MQRATRFLAIFLVLGMLTSLMMVVPVQAATISIDPDTGVYKDIITVTGSGFTDGAIYYITWDPTDLDGGTTELARVTAASGAINVDFDLPSGIEGEHTINARLNTKTGTIVATTYFTVDSVITLSKSSASAGSSITVYGYGFGYDETNIQITIENPSGSISNVGSTKTANTLGYWTNTITLPSNLTSGEYTISAYGDDSDVSTDNDATIQINAVASLNLSQSSGKAGTSITVNGSGFSANESNIRVFFNGNQIGNSTAATSNGTWSITFTIPQLAGGSYTVSASGNSTTDAPTQNFTITSGFTLSKPGGSPGTVITVTGYGFASGESGITITYDGTPVGSPTSAGANGAWSATFTVPPGNAGNHTVNAYGSSTAQSSPTPFVVSAGISINKDSGETGTPITISGTGFVAGEKSITVLFDAVAVPALSNITAGPNGAWTANFTIPPVAGGDHTIDAQGATTKATAISDVTFTVKASVTISSKSGASGSTINFTGSGFASSEKNISINFDDHEAASGITADTKGSWSTSITVPPLSSGSHVIKVSGSSTQSLDSGDLSFKIAAGISVNPSMGTIGSSVSITGSGFAPNSPLRISFDDIDLNVGRVISDGTGSFNKSITVPKSTSGSHSLKVTDAQNNMGDSEFSIDSTPPSVPKLQAPADGEKSGFFGDAAPTFQWQKSTSPNSSALTYILQISAQSDFSETILEKTDLTATKYTLTKSEALPGGTYFWRVKAIDAASNSSAWTQPFQIQSGSISVGLFMLVIFLIIAILVAVYILFIRKILARRKMERAAQVPGGGVPSVVNAEYRIIDQDDPDKKKALPWRLALPQAPQPPKGGKNLSAEDQARLKNIIDFAMSLPLAQPGNDTGWLVELAENETGNTETPSLYAQILKGEIQPHYEPTWMRHPTFMDLQVLLEGQSILQDLNSYIDSFNRTASEAISLLQGIYKDTSAEVTWDILPSGGWGFVSGVYNDSVSWFLGKQLREPSDRNYIIKPNTGNGSDTNTIGLFGEQNTAFKGTLVLTQDEQDAISMRALHLKLRKSYRSNDKVREIVSMITQLDVQRTRITNAFNQFNKLNT
jgi:hypothetical protein